MIKQVLTGFQYLHTIQYQTNTGRVKLILTLLNFQDLKNIIMFFNCLLSAYTHASFLKQHTGLLVARHITVYKLSYNQISANADIFWWFFPH